MKKLSEQIHKWNDLRAQLENVEDMDEICLLDCLEGETELIPILLEIDKEIFEREASIKALKDQIETLNIRKSRHEKCVEKLRTLILNIMDNAGIPTIKGTNATLTVSKTNPKLEINNEAEIPSKFWIERDPELDKDALIKALKNNEEVAGVTLSQNGILLTIRRK